MTEISIDDVVDLNKSFRQIDQLIEYIDKIDKKIQEINKKQIEISGVQSLKDLKAVMQDLQKITRDLTDTVSQNVKATNEQAKSGKAAEEGARRQLSAFEKLKKEYREAVDNARSLAVEYGVESEQALEAAKAADVLKAKLDAANNLVKKPSQKADVPAEDVPFTNNLAQLEQERQLLESNSEAVSELDRAEADAVMTAKEWADAQKQASDTTEDSKQHIDEIVGAFDSYTGSIKENISLQLKNVQALAQNKREQKEIEDAIKKSSGASDTQIQKLAQLKADAILLTEANKSLSVTIRNQAKEYISTEGSIDKLQSQVNLLQQAYESLSEEERNSPFGQELKKDIDTLEPKVKELEGTIGKFSRNVGNYGGAFKSALDVLNSRLSSVREQLKDPSLSGKQMESLKKEEQEVSKWTVTLGQDFTSSRTAMKAFNEAVVSMGLELGETNDTVVSFQQAVGKGVNEINDFKAAVKFNASDTKYLDGLVSTVNGLAGAYGAAQGAAQLFSDDNENLQKQMVKLQAILTIINGLQAIQNALQTESGTIQLALAAKTALLNAAKAAEAAIFGAAAAAVQAEAVAQAEAAVAAQANAVAQGENAIATEAAVIAQTENIAVTSAATVAAEGQAAATTAATVATSTLRTALIASGIGAIILGIGAAVVFLISKMKFWKNENQELIKQEDALTEAIKTQNQAIQNNINLTDNRYQGAINNAQKALDQADAENKSDERKFALKKKLLDLQKAQADDKLNQKIVQAEGEYSESGVKGLEALEAARAGHLVKYRQYNDQIKGLAGQLSKLDVNDSDNDNKIEGINKTIDLLQKQADAEKQSADEIISIKQESFDADKNLNLLSLEEATFTAEQKRKIALESAQINAEELQSINENILNDERSSLQQRLVALSQIAKAQRSVIQAEVESLKSQRAAGTINGADYLIGIKKAAADERAIILENETAKLKLKEDFRLRDLNAQSQILIQQKQLQAEANRDLAGNDQFVLENRLKFQQAYIEAQRTVIDEEHRQKLESVKNTFLTDQEKLQIEKDYETKVLQLAIEAHKGITEIIKSEIEKQQQLREEDIEQIKRVYSNLDLKTSVDYSQEVVALNDALKKGEITREAYNKRRLEIDRKYSRQAVQIQIDEIETVLKNYRGAEAAIEASEIRLQSLKEKLNQRETESTQQIADLEEKKRRAKSEGEKAMYDALIQLAKSRTKTEREELLKQIDLAEADLKVAKINYEEKKKMLEELAKLRKQVSDQGKSDDDDDAESFRNKFLGVLDSANGLGQALQTLGEGSFNRRMQQIQDEMTALSERYEHEKELIEKTSANELEKKQRLAEAEAKYAGQRKALEQQEKQERIRKAEFDKKAAIFNIVINTARAVVEALPNIPKAVTAGVLGAAQMAVAIAAPIPRFFKGKNLSRTQANDNYEGPALVDDAGKAELIIREDGSMEVGTDRPRITYLKKNDIVLPDAKVAQQTIIHRSMLNSQKALQDFRYIVVPNNGEVDALREQTSVFKKEIRHLREDVRATGKTSRKTNWHDIWAAQDLMRTLNSNN